MGKPGLTCEPLRGRLWWPMPAPVGPEGSGRLLPKSAGVSFARAEACQELLEAAAEQLALVPGEDLEAMQILAPALVSLSRLRWRHPTCLGPS